MPIPIAGYADRWSVGQNENIEFKVSSQFSKPYSVRLVRIVCADPNPDGPGIIEEDMSSVFSGEFSSRNQDVQLGSYGIVLVNRRLSHPDGYTIAVTIWPTLVDAGVQGILCLQDQSGNRLIELRINSVGQVAAVIGGGSGSSHEFATGLTLRERAWHAICLCVDRKQNRLGLIQTLKEDDFVDNDSGEVWHDCTNLPSLQDVDKLLIASSGGNPLGGFFNGKIEQPSILARTYDVEKSSQRVPHGAGDSLLALWDFSRDISTQEIREIGPLHLDGRLVNCPARAMRGSNWTGKEMCWRHAPEEYGAIHFHDDDIYDCQWKTDFSFKIPGNFRSAMYSMRIECEDAYEDIPFYVRPKTNKPQARICVLVSTFTYTVYTNQARSLPKVEYAKLVQERGTRPWNPDQVQDYGLSTYNNHRDGSGICYSSRLRPSLTMRPKYITICRPYAESGMRHLPADTHLFAWLENQGQDFDVITDEDLHEEGVELLRPYKVVMTPSHPEYHTTNTLNAIYEYTRSGGRLMYLGGNGFYWKVAVNENLPGMVEIRRAEGGIRTWAAEPGEYYNSLDGEYGGMWLRNGRPPQSLAGVGFTAQGDFQGTYYRRNSDLDAKYEWVFEGVDDEILGDFGLSGGGAAGFELDRADFSLGTPRNTAVLASSENYPEHFVLVPEEILSHIATRSGKPVSELIRSDIVIFETAKGGRVFSVGSITYCGSLPWNNFDNNISRMTANVLNRFLEV